MIIFLLFVNNNIMTNEEYDLLIKKHIVENNIYKNVLIAFLSGGFIELFGEIITRLFIKYINLNINDAYLCTTCVYIVIASILTGLGFFDKILSICKCGLIVPITGFAHSMMSATMEYKKEGLITGIGSNMFKLSGTVIMCGVVSAYFFSILRYFIFGG